MQNILTILYPVLLAILTGVLSYLGKEVIKLMPKLIEFAVTKIGLANYQKTRLIGLDVWNIIEEHFRVSQIVGETVQAKIIMFETLIKQKIPGITDAEIETIRQAIAGEFNKQKSLVIKQIENPIIIADPIVKYFNAEGIELQPISSPETV